ncbi:MAG TPA: hypothetical protein VK278_00670 [Gaiellaceae bacterium]|nr:hypothetical protein [Gaiellaceae bacterium]
MDPEEIRWLAETTGLDVREVQEGFEKGDLRRKVVVDELLEAGLEGQELLELVIRLTGLSRAEAIRLIAAERATGEHEPEAPPTIA